MPKKVRPFGQDRPSVEELQQLQKQESASKIPPASLGVTLDDILKSKGQQQPADEHSASAAALPHHPSADEHADLDNSTVAPSPALSLTLRSSRASRAPTINRSALRPRLL